MPSSTSGFTGIRLPPRQSRTFWLDEADIRYIQEVVKWDKLDKYADAVRQALQAEQAIRSPLW